MQFCECGGVAIDGGGEYTKVTWTQKYSYTFTNKDGKTSLVKSPYKEGDFRVGLLSWSPGDVYKHRIFIALNMVDKNAARRYYMTTHT